ncbi:MAG: protein kinase [Gammaproteobacteria bacterium]|nr:protein kinase [Gammaproteobacteria bacterium]
MPERIHRNSLKPDYRLHWYVIERVIGQGGFGITYLATDTNLDRRVAIKEYLPMELAVREGDDSVYPATEKFGDRFQWGLDRFIAEARTLARFRHPGIVRVLSVFEANKTAYMVMEYERGESLQEMLTRRHTLEEGELMNMLMPLLGGLSAIHEAGFIHRDIKPANILIRNDGSPVLIDFGSARQALGQQTRALTSVVSPGYAPYEQYYSKSDKQGPWTDIYGLGATLYRAVSGRAPLDAIDRSEAILKAERDVIVGAEEVGSGRYSARFLKAIDHALQFRECDRPQSVAEWVAEFGVPDESETSTEIAVEPDEDRTDFGRILSPAVAADAADPDAPPGRPERARLRPLPVLLLLLAVAGGVGGWWLLSDNAAARQWLTGIRVALLAMPGPTDARRATPARVAAPIEELAAGLEADAGHDGRQLAALLDRARLAAGAGHVLEPEGENAVALYRKVLALDAGNADARSGLAALAQGLADRARTAIDLGNLDQAGELLDEADALDGGAHEALRRTLVQRRETAGAERAREKLITEHLAAAQAAGAAGRFSGGADSALSHYRAVLALAPGDARAESGITGLAEEQLRRAALAIDAGDEAGANEALAAAGEIRPEAAGLADLRRKLTARKTAAKDAARVQRLLADAREDIAALRLTAPDGNNAVERYRQVLAIEPDNQQAHDGLVNVAERYVWLTDQAIAAADLTAADRYLNDARKLAPRAPAVGRAAQALEAAREQAQRPREDAAGMTAGRQPGSPRQQEDGDRGAAEHTRGQEAESAAARAAEATRQALIDAVPKAAVLYDGFEDQHAYFGLTRTDVRALVESRLTRAGVQVLPADQARKAKNARLIEVYFRANLNETTGTYSYAAKITARQQMRLASGAVEFSPDPLWSAGENGALRAVELRRLYDLYGRLLEQYLRERPPQAATLAPP